MPKVAKVGKFRRAATTAQRTKVIKKDDDDIIIKSEQDSPNNTSASVTQKQWKAKIESSAEDATTTTTTTKVNPNNNKGNDTTKQQIKNEKGTPLVLSNDSKSTKPKSSNFDSIPSTTEPLSKGQRKRQAKRNQYLKKEQMILSSLQLKRSEEQKKRIDGLDALKEALMATVSETSESKDDTTTNKTKSKDGKKEESSNLLKSNKGRQELIKKEIGQLNLVLQHPVFVQDPFGTMKTHLQNTLAANIEKQKVDQQRHTQQKKQNDVAKKEIKKALKSSIVKPINKKKKGKFKATRSKSK